MRMNTLIEKIKQHPDYPKAGMILTHNGVVRQTSRDGRPVTGLRVAVDYDKLERIVTQKKQIPGIVEILVEIFDERNLAVGDDVMFLVVAGDIRETVITTLSETLNAIKTMVTKKTEYFK
ncbi:MAG: molybdenum cofactor biosynthesis protein MoaE [Deltaproteobacteria bacterium]|nr:molybdenum cofactor biosynthesis protein MoaE [Deltaproteobacteria bacterium]